MKNKGLRQYRFRNNPLEEKFANEWEKINSGGFREVLDFMLSKDVNCPNSMDISDRDREVAATIIQWLGSPVGKGFLKKVGFVEYPDINKISKLITKAFLDKYEIKKKSDFNFFSYIRKVFKK